MNDAVTQSRLDVLEALLTRVSARAVVAPTSFVYRPGYTGSAANVYSSWPLLYAAFSQVQGSKSIQIDDSIVSPAVIPAGTYDLADTLLTGPLEPPPDGIPIKCDLADGCMFAPFFPGVAGAIVVNCLSRSVPVHTLTANDQFQLSAQAVVQNDPTSTVPMFHLPAGLGGKPIVFVEELSSFGTTGHHIMRIDAPGSCNFGLNSLAVLPNDVLIGTGSAEILAIDQSVFAFTPLPILQPALASTIVSIFSFADLTGFMTALTAGNWAGAPPTDVRAAIERMASLLKTLNGGVPIP